MSSFKVIWRVGAGRSPYQLITFLGTKRKGVFCVVWHELIFLHRVSDDVKVRIADLSATQNEEVTGPRPGEEGGYIGKDIASFDNGEPQPRVIDHELGAGEIVSGGYAEQFEDFGIVDGDNSLVQGSRRGLANRFLDSGGEVELDVEPILRRGGRRREGGQAGQREDGN